MTKLKQGSGWYKWDLHVHTPFTKLSNSYGGEENVWDEFCRRIEDSDVMVFGITDYFSAENYFTFLDKFKGIYPRSKKVFFPNIELRLEVSVNREAEEVNMHVIFDNSVKKGQLNKFLNELKTNISQDGSNKNCNELSGAEYESAGVDYKEIRLTLHDVFGDKDEPYLIFAAANNSGLRATRSPRKLNISDEIDKVCDGFFGGSQNVEYFLNTGRYEKNVYAEPKPVISGSDVHSFGDIDNWL